MKTKFKLIQALSIISAGLLFSTGAFANELVNGGFELNPPTSGFGNHLDHSIAPWVLGSGSRTNVIRTNQGINSTGDGPRSDASGAPSGTIRNYLDIAYGKNDFYQTFTATCNGEADFGGYFSTRGNKKGTGSVTLRNGTGFTGSIVGQSNPVVLSGGNSQTDPWTLVSYTTPVVAGSTYSLVIAMDDNMNFDEAFVNIAGCGDGTGTGGIDNVINHGEYEVAVAVDFSEVVIDRPVEDCCPPINEQAIIRQLSPIFQPGGGLNAKYRLNFSASAQFNNQMQSYLNYANSMRPPINKLTSAWTIYDKGPGGFASPVPAPMPLGTQIEQFATTFHVTNPLNHGNTSSNYTMKPNNWYRVQVVTTFNNNQNFYAKECELSEYWMNWQTGGNKSSTSNGDAGSFVISDGKKELARIKVTSKSKSAPMKTVPMRRR